MTIFQSAYQTINHHTSAQNKKILHASYQTATVILCLGLMLAQRANAQTNTQTNAPSPLQIVQNTKSPESLTIYSARSEHLIKPLLNLYQQQTGTQITLVSDKEAPLMERIKQEGQSTLADMLITVDAGNLWQASQMGLLQSIQSKTLQTNIPKHLQDPNKQWFGLSVRARTIFYNNQMVKPQDLSTYSDLANSKWAGKLCLRSSKKVYNQSLIGMLVREQGLKPTQIMLDGWVKNLATNVFSDDTKLLEAIASGQCQVGIANTYYYGRLKESKPDLPVSIFWANQQSSGVHINISGAGITRYSKNKNAAVKFLEWLSSSQAQNLFADKNLEYPANPSVKPDAIVASWGSFKASTLNVAQAGQQQIMAVKLMDMAGYK